MIKLCVFDFDATLMDGETINFLADANGVGEEAGEITKKAMSGELDFFESLTRRVSLLKGLPLAVADKVCSNLPLMNGAKELIAHLKNKGMKVIVFSGGFHLGTDKAMDKLNFDASFANTLHHKDGILTGFVGGEMMFGYSKGSMLATLQRLLGISQEETMSVGDGANDLSMFAYSNLKIAFCAKEILRAEATHCIDTKDLRKIINLI